MASAAAVAADSMESPLDETSADGVITGSVHPNTLALADSSEADRSGALNENEDAVDEDDLFGDEDEDSVPDRRRHLEEEELDSGDDLERADRLPDDEDEAPEFEQRAINLLDVDLTRSAVPQGSDGEIYLLKMPDFLEIDPKAFSLASFKPPTTDHRRKGEPSSTFSAYGTAMTTIRWRRSPSKPSELQSNARILRWSDGSLTMQLASDPLIQYELPSNPLAPPQINPAKPTPTSVLDRKNRSYRTPYNVNQDGFTYLATPHPEHAIMRFTNKITTGLHVESFDSSGTDEALWKLQDSMAAAQRAREQAYAVDIGVVLEDGDPELAKKRAEAAEKEKMRAQRKLENQINRDRDRANRTLGRAGLRTGGGLTIGGLEDDLDGGGGGRYASGRPSKPKKRRPLRDEYSDEDDYMGKRRTREDEYDEEDDFIAGSDEEEAVEDDEEDLDERIEAQERERMKRRDGSRSPKRAVDDQQDADGEVDDDVGDRDDSPKAVKRRRVIDDDEEDE